MAEISLIKGGGGLLLIQMIADFQFLLLQATHFSANTTLWLSGRQVRRLVKLLVLKFEILIAAVSIWSFS